MSWEFDWITAKYDFDRYEWDHEKARRNARKHKVGFEDASAIFDEEVVVRQEIVDDEERNVAIGEQGPRELVVVFVERDDVCRIVSARKATPTERRRYRAHISR